jgi:hypothetical protein
MTDLDETATMVSAHVAVDGRGFLLAQGEDLGALKGRIEGAAHDGGKFVDFMIVGDRLVSIFVTTGTHIVISISTAEFDASDDGDDSAPFGGEFDLM